MCSNYLPVTRAERLLTYFGVERARDEPPVDVWPIGLAPFIRLSVGGPGGQQVDDGIQWAREIGVTGVPTFVVADKWAVVGAQDYTVFESLMQKLGKEPRV